jgi:hypothetical protein
MVDFRMEELELRMLETVVWAGLYTLILLGVGWVIGSWSERTWFKILLLPGTLLGAMIQALSALVCVGSIKAVHFFRDHKPFLELEQSRLPYFGGGLRVLLAHLFLFTVFFFVVSEAAAVAEVDVHALHLPELCVEEVLDGDVEITAGLYLAEARDWVADVSRRPLVALVILYLAVALFSALKMTASEWRCGAFVLLAIGCIGYVGIGYGMGFRTFSRGWWASWLYFPQWWELFSLFVTLSVLSLCFLTCVRLVTVLIRRTLAMECLKKSCRRP